MIEFLATNWLWIVLIVGFIAMHRSGMGCGMGHGSTHRQGEAQSDTADDEGAPRRR